MKFLNILTNKEKEERDVVIKKEYTKEFLVNVPHAGTLIPSSVKDHFNFGWHILLGTDLHTEKLFNFYKGIFITTKINPNCVNTSRPRRARKDPSLPNSLRHDPLDAKSLTSSPILLKKFTTSEKNKLLKYYNK